MKQTYLTLLFISLLSAFGVTAVRTRPQAAQKKAPIAVTLETKDSVVPFRQPLNIRVILRNVSPQPLSINPASLKLHFDGWRVIGTNGQWSGNEGLQLTSEQAQPERVELAPGATLTLSAVHEYTDFEMLGPNRVDYRLASTDPATKELFPADKLTLRFEIPPTKLIAAVWGAQTEAERKLAQPEFNEFLKLSAKTENDEQDYVEFNDNNKMLFFMAGYALPFLDQTPKDQDPVVRQQAVLAYPVAVRAIDQLNEYLQALDAFGPRPQWAKNLKKNWNKDADWRSFAVAALNDSAPSVRIAALGVLTTSALDEFNERTTARFEPKSEPEKSKPSEANELGAIRKLATDPDAGVRTAVQKYLRSFAGKENAADSVVVALLDSDRKVREEALNSLRKSPEPPPLDMLKNAFAKMKGEIAVGLIPLLFEQEDASLANTLSKDFSDRSVEERLAIMTTIAGHADTAALELVKLGLKDPAPSVQRAALLRATIFSPAVITPLIDNYARQASPELQKLALEVKQEIEKRTVWPFLKTTATASESIFPSQNGSRPITSPDGKWVAYLESGWGRPGGSGGFGRSNLISISRVVPSNGTDDRVISDMFPRNWLTDSNHVGTARDGFVAISDLDGKVVSEFGEPLEEQYRRSQDAGTDWTKGDLRSQMGDRMPHEKRLSGVQEFDYGERGAFSPDGKLFGPLRGPKGYYLLSTDGQRIPLKLLTKMIESVVWSPDGRYVFSASESGWQVIDVRTRSAQELQTDPSARESGSELRAGRWNPWSRDGSLLTFLRGGQIWISSPNGEDAKQLTFDSSQKALPTFSRDDRSIAYITWQKDDRDRYPRLGPSDLWVLDVATTIATRVTAAAKGRINSFDWLDDNTLIFDRVEEDTAMFVPRSTLRRLSLSQTSQ